MIDVGGDVIANGDEPGLRSPLCDAIMLAAAARLAANRVPVLLGIFGAGCDAELTSDEVLERIAEVAAAGGLCGARGLTEPIAERLERCVELVPTEASAVAVRAFRGVRGPVSDPGRRSHGRSQYRGDDDLLPRCRGDVRDRRPAGACRSPTPSLCKTPTTRWARWASRPSSTSRSSERAGAS